MLVSIITPCYNVEGFLSETIESVLRQRYINWELIIVDDCSTDNSLALAQSYAKKDNRIKVVKMPENGGAAAARNMGTRLASGNFIAFLDSDDLWDERKLEIQIREMVEKQVYFSYTGYNVISEKGKYLKVLKIPEYTYYRKLLKGCDIGCLTVVYNVDKIGKQYFLEEADEKEIQIPKSILRTWGREDYVLWMNLAKKYKQYGNMLGINIPLASYRKRTMGLSFNKRKSSFYQWMVYRQVEKLGLFISCYLFVLYTLNGIKKHYF